MATQQFDYTKALKKAFGFSLFFVPGLIFLLVPAHFCYILVCKFKYEMDVTVLDAVQLMLFGFTHFKDMQKRNAKSKGADSASYAAATRKNL